MSDPETPLVAAVMGTLWARGVLTVRFRWPGERLFTNYGPHQLRPEHTTRAPPLPLRLLVVTLELPRTRGRVLPSSDSMVRSVDAAVYGTLD